MPFIKVIIVRSAKITSVEGLSRTFFPWLRELNLSTIKVIQLTTKSRSSENWGRSTVRSCASWKFSTTARAKMKLLFQELTFGWRICPNCMQNGLNSLWSFGVATMTRVGLPSSKAHLYLRKNWLPTGFHPNWQSATKTLFSRHLNADSDTLDTLLQILSYQDDSYFDNWLSVQFSQLFRCSTRFYSKNNFDCHLWTLNRSLSKYFHILVLWSCHCLLLNAHFLIRYLSPDTSERQIIGLQ